MFSLVKLFVNICLLRANPQDLPNSRALEAATLLAYTLLGYLGASLSSASHTALLMVVVDVAMLAGLGYAGLWIQGQLNRATQTVTALAGSGAVIELIALPMMALLPGESGAAPSLLAELAWAGLVLWLTMVIAHILRHALSMNFLIAVVIAFMYMFMSLRVMRTLLVAAQSGVAP